MKLLAFVLAAAALTAGPAHARRDACNRAAARAAITSTHLRMTLIGESPTRIDPSSADAVLCYDFTRDGRVDLAATIASGGTAGDIGYVVFRATASGWRVALARGGYKVGIARLGGDLVSTQPVYKLHDANCCPTGGFDHLRFHWTGTRFTVARSWHTKTPSP